ncbi:MAG: hypothetical protein WCQ50_13225 [Spirochaetota bacterium]
MPDARMFPLPGIGNKASLYGILIDVQESSDQSFDPLNDPGVEAISPEMPCPAPFFVVSLGEVAELPLHYIRKTYTSCRADHEMDVVPHYAEIHDLECVLLLAAQKELEK